MLANLNGEPGGDRLTEYLDDAAISVISYVEIMTKLMDSGAPFEAAEQSLGAFGLRTIDVSLEIARRAVQLRHATRPRGLSLGDRICLATAVLRRVPAVTADRAWADLDVGVAIELIR